MPRRSNKFQELIASIERALAPLNATVTESAMLLPVDGGDEREVDVLIELEVGGHDVRIAIECRDHKRKQGLSWLEELDGKFRYLPVNKIVAVSASGFTKTATKRAAFSKIQLLTLREAEKTDWPKELSRWIIALILWHYQLVSALPVFCGEGPVIEPDALKKCEIVGAEGQKLSTFEDDVAAIYRADGATIIRQWSSENQQMWTKAPPGTNFDVTSPYVAHGRYLKAPDGRSYQLAEIMVTLRTSHTVIPAIHTHYSYNGKPVTVAHVDESVTGAEGSFVMTYDDHGEPTKIVANITRGPRDGVVGKNR